MQDLKEALNNPNARAFLDIIARGEGTLGVGDNGYNVNFGGSTFDSYADHPRQRREFTQTDGKRNLSSAAGRYQQLEGTYDDYARRLGITDFSPESQDLIALALIRDNGALADVLAGNYSSAIDKLGNIWASFPSSPYPQNTHTKEFLLGQEQPNVVNVGGQQMVALPESDYERDMVQTLNAGYNPTGSADMNSILTNAVATVAAARERVKGNNTLISTLPTEMDDDLLDLIDKADIDDYQTT